MSPRGHLFYVDFLFFIFWKHSHRDEKYSHRGEKYFHRGGKSRDLWRHLRAPPSRAEMRHHSSHYWNSMEHRQVHSTRVWVPTIKYNKAIRDGRPRPPRHQCVYQISSWSVEKWLNYDVGYTVTAKNGIYRNFIWGVRTSTPVDLGNYNA